MADMNNGLEPTGMSWADMVEEDLANEYDEGYVETIGTEEEETTKVQPKYNSWANMIKQEKQSIDTPNTHKLDTRDNQPKLDEQENQIKKMEKEEGEETDKNNSKEAATTNTTTTTTTADTTLEKEAVINGDTKKEESTGEETQGLRSSRWANAPPTKKEPKSQYNNNNNNNSRYYKEDSDSNYNRYTSERQNRYRDENNYRKYNNHNDSDNGYGNRQTDYDSSRIYKNNDNRRYNDDKYSNNQYQQRHTSKTYDNDDEGNWRGRSNKANYDNNSWKQSNKTDNNSDKSKGLTGTSASKWASESRSSRWANEDRSSKWKSYAKTTEQYYNGNNTYTSNESTNSKENTSQSSSWENNEGTMPPSIKSSWKNDNDISTSNKNSSWDNDNYTSTSNKSSSWADDTIATTSDNYTWSDIKNTNNTNSKDQVTENWSSHETRENEQMTGKKSTVGITTWKEMILTNGNTADSGTANQAWQSVASSATKAPNESVNSTQDIPTTDLNSDLLDVKNDKIKYSLDQHSNVEEVNDNIKLISKSPTAEPPLTTIAGNRHEVKAEDDHSLKYDETNTPSLEVEQSATKKVDDNVNLWKQFALEHSISDDPINISSVSSQGSSHTSTSNPTNTTVKKITQIDTIQGTQPKTTNQPSSLKHKKEEIEKKGEGDDWEALQQQMMQSWST